MSFVTSSAFIFAAWCAVLALAIPLQPPHNSGETFLIPPTKLAQAPYADWAHHHWIWYHNSQNNQANNTKLVDDYLARRIKVGVLNIDSGWETGYNSFVFNPQKFPDPKAMIDHLHSIDVKVTTWITSMVNIDSPNFQYCLDNGFFLNEGQLVEWWRGTGAFFDYTHPRGIEYWHSLMKGILDLGVDGWKTDGTDPYFYALGPNVRGYAGRISQPFYADAYYGDFFNYSIAVKGQRQALIMSRPVDTGLSFSPYYVMFSGWVGDQESDFGGLKKAMTNMLQSAFRNYLNFGSDIAGYRSDTAVPRTKELLIRWAQLSAFNPLMENGGSGVLKYSKKNSIILSFLRLNFFRWVQRVAYFFIQIEKEHRPWMYDEETTDIYRKFVDIHYTLCTFFLNAGTQAYAASRSVMQPLGQDLPVPDRFDFLLWNDILVSPVLDYGTQFTIDIPSGRWVDWWDSSVVYTGPASIRYDCPYDRFPVFLRAGAIIPLDLEYGGQYPHNHRGLLTLSTVWPKGSKSFVMHESHGDGLEASYHQEGESVTFSISSYTTRPLALRIGGPSIRSLSSIRIQTSEGTFDLPGLDVLPPKTRITRGWMPYKFDDGEHLVVMVGSARGGLRIQVDGLKFE